LTSNSFGYTMTPMPLQPGSILNDRYRIEDKLGCRNGGGLPGPRSNLNIRVAVKENLNANPAPSGI
jgi:hypothetical protein